MAVIAVIMTLMVLTAGYVRSQSTTDDDDTSLPVQIAQLQQQPQQMAQVLVRILELQQQQLSKLNEIQTLITNSPGM